MDLSLIHIWPDKAVQPCSEEEKEARQRISTNHGKHITGNPPLEYHKKQHVEDNGIHCAEYEMCIRDRYDIFQRRPMRTVELEEEK